MKISLRCQAAFDTKKLKLQNLTRNRLPTCLHQQDVENDHGLSDMTPPRTKNLANHIFSEFMTIVNT